MTKFQLLPEDGWNPKDMDHAAQVRLRQAMIYNAKAAEFTSKPLPPVPADAPAWVKEVMALADGAETRPTFGELIIRTAPTRNLVVTGGVVEHGILVWADREMPERFLQVGVPDRGWANVQDPFGTVEQRRASGALSINYERISRWPCLAHAQNTLVMQDMLYLPIRGWEALPEHVKLTQYDVGHHVVFTRGELMGRTGTVRTLIHEEYRNGHTETALRVSLKGGSDVTTLMQAVGATINSAESAYRAHEGIVSMGVRFPPGSRVQVRQRTRAGQQGTWVPGISVGWDNGLLHVLTEGWGGEEGALVRFSREAVVGPDETPPDWVSGTAKGTNPAPRLKRKPKTFNVPPAEPSR